jgi:RNA polymerase sigma factor for flagellar operon FliA
MKPAPTLRTLRTIPPANCTEAPPPASGRRPRVPTMQEMAPWMPIVHQMVARFLRRLPPNVLRDDLVAAGTFGLIDALRRSADSTTQAFEWYARVRVRGAIVDELRAQDWLSRRARRRVTASAEASGTAVRTAVVSMDDVSLEVQARSFVSTTERDPLALFEERATRQQLLAALETLPAREREILHSHYFCGIAFKTIAATLRVSEPRVSQLHSRAVKLMRAAIESAEQVVAA